MAGLNIILVRILPTQPRAPTDFANDLAGLSITAYDLTIDDNNTTTGGVFLGTATGVVTTITPSFGNVPYPLERQRN